ncbi:MAG: exodeoxyribonuclease VII small subunit [Planctomycetota bacterium]
MTKQKMTFEQALENLEQIVSSIESGEIGLEESIAKYAEGIKLIKHCRRVLDAAEKKIQLLTAEDDQTLTAAGELEELEEE